MWFYEIGITEKEGDITLSQIEDGVEFKIVLSRDQIPYFIKELEKVVEESKRD